MEIVNPVPLDDAEPWMRQLRSTLLGNPETADFHRRTARRTAAWDAERVWAVRDRGRIVGTLVTFPRVLTVPGPGASTRDLTVDALSGVTVSATHRRRGLLSDMIGRSLRAAKDRGDAVSILVAAEWPIYGRFGYAPATLATGYRLHPRRPGAVVDGADPSTVHQVEVEQAGPVADRVFDLARRRRAGQVDRHAPWWTWQLGLDEHGRDLEDDALWFVHEGPDGPDGVVAWKVTKESSFTELGSIEVTQLFGATPAAERDLWGYLSGIDIVDRIDLWPRPVDETAHHLLRDGRALHQTQVNDLLWVRLLDVPAALEARAYACDGEAVLDVLDPATGGYGAGRVLLSVAGGEVSCTRTDRAADVRLDQGTLASTYLGGHSLRALADVHAVDELTPGTVDRLAVMFWTPLAPFTETIF